MRSAVYAGTLLHARRTPARHVFRYPVSYWLFDLDELPDLERRLRLFSVNRRNVVSLSDADHFDGSALKRAVVELADDPSIERVLMLTQPRVLGYVFNPVSFYWCYRGDGSLACVVAELNNTFGERLPEVLRGPELRYEQRKRLHVSPFFGLDQSYEYAFSQPGDEVWARIHVRDDAGPERRVRNDHASLGCDGWVRCKDAGSVNSSAIRATEDAAACPHGAAENRRRHAFQQTPARSLRLEAQRGHVRTDPSPGTKSGLW